MYVPHFVTEALGWLSYQFIQVQPFIPTYTHLVVSAVFPIYAGAFSSLSRPSSAAKPEKKKGKHGKDSIKDEDEEEERHMEGLSPTDAIVFPVLAGCTLAGLYFLIKWLQDPALLNKILNWYFAFFSVFSVSTLVSDGLGIAHSLLFPRHYMDKGKLFQIETSARQAVTTHERLREYRQSPLPGIFSRLPLSQSVSDALFWLYVLPTQKLTFKAFVRSILSVKVHLGLYGFQGLITGLGSVLYYNFVGKPWFLTNIMGFGFAYGALQLMSPTTFWTGTLILSALFFYDIYFVFFTPMMVTVAKSLDIPIKLLFPRPTEPDADPSVQAMSMLGLGDVVLPGMMIGLALRFDLFMFYLRRQTKFSSLPPVSPNPEQPSDKGKESKASADQIIKAPYKPVSEGWGDRFWTSSIFGEKPKSFTPRGDFPKPYFHASLVGYVLGMLTTLGAMQVSEHPQPALLYLVPGVLSSLWGAAWLRGEFREMWEYSELSEENEGEDKKKSKDVGEDKEQVGKDADQKDRKVKSQSSIFSYSRAEQRSKRLEGAINKQMGQDQYEYYEEEEEEEEEEDNKQSSEGQSGAADSILNTSDQAKAQGPVLFSISIRAPKSPFLERVFAPESEKAHGVVGKDEEQEQSPQARHSAAKPSLIDGDDKDREHVHKRLRIS